MRQLHPNMTCILISTFDRFEWLARWTHGRIDREWEDHPPVFFAGLSRRDERSFGFEGDASDWMGVNLQAVLRLRELGFTHSYLILDDHPPVGRCHSEFLNHRLPEFADRLGAATIGLLGYGQHRTREGTDLGSSNGHLEKTDPSYRWKFSLHPALWRLEDLQALLECRMETYPAGQRTPWNFERHRDVPGDPRVDGIAARCFRILGSSCRAPGSRANGTLAFEALVRFAVDVELFVAKASGGKDARDAAELRRLWLFGHYLGPYPVYWSGCMRQGKPHLDYERWLERFGPGELRLSWRGVSGEGLNT